MNLNFIYNNKMTKYNNKKEFTSTKENSSNIKAFLDNRWVFEYLEEYNFKIREYIKQTSFKSDDLHLLSRDRLNYSKDLDELQGINKIKVGIFKEKIHETYIKVFFRSEEFSRSIATNPKVSSLIISRKTSLKDILVLCNEIEISKLNSEFKLPIAVIDYVKKSFNFQVGI